MNRLALLAVIALSMLACGCAGKINPAEITPGNLSVTQRHTQTVLVHATGGGESNDFAGFNITNDTLQQAIMDSVVHSGLFAHAVKDGPADYKLDALLAIQDQPQAGLVMTSNANVVWKLTRTRDGKQVFQDAIETTDTKTMGDALVGAERQRKSFTGAIQKNIKEAIERMSSTPL